MSITPYWAGNNINSSSIVFTQHKHSDYNANITPVWAGSTTSSVSVYPRYFNSEYSMSINPGWGGNTITGSGFIYSVNLSSSRGYTVSEVGSNHSMSLDSNWTGGTWTGSLGYSDSDLFTIKDGDNKTQLTVDKSGDVQMGGYISASAFNLGELSILNLNYPVATGDDERLASFTAFMGLSL